MRYRPAPFVCRTLWLCAAATGLAASRYASAQTVAPPLTPTADAFLSAANPTNNYGGAGALSLAGPAASNAKGAFDSLVRFNTGSSKSAFDAAYGPGKWTVQSATLQLTSASPNNAIFNASAQGNFTVSLESDDTWVEGTGMPNSPSATGVTWNNQPSAAGDVTIGTFNFNGSTSGATPYTLPLPPAFASALAAGGDANLRLTPSDAAVSYLFNARTGPNNTSPVLTLSAVPEPAGAAPVAAAVALLLGVRAARPRRLRRTEHGGSRP